jgi:hypothetical protein
MTNKTKNIILVIGFLLALILCYKLAISKTVVLQKQYETLNHQKVLFENTPKLVSLLKQKEKYYDSLLSKYHLDESSFQNNLLKTLNTFADSSHIKVINFLEPHTIKQNDLKTNTYQFTLQGDFNAILSLVYQLEQGTKFGEIIGLHYKKEQNYRNGKYYLQAKVLLKSFS